MQSLKELYKIGRGPSSSHTLAPERACRLFLNTFGPSPYYEVELYGSLSLTGHGHSTDHIIQETLPGETKIFFKTDWEESFPNGFYLRSYDENHVLEHQWTVFSIGGGSIEIKELELDYNDERYFLNSFAEIRKYLFENQLSLVDYIVSVEGKEIYDYLGTILDAEILCVTNGLNNEGLLPGKLHIKRTANQLYKQANTQSVENQDKIRLMAYAYAAAEENAAGHTCVTAPTLGACGVMASLLYYYSIDKHYNRKRLIEGLMVGGIFGNLIKHNATISGAVGGCQAEIGAAISMASATAAYFEGLNLNQIEYAAEIGMEHHLGLTCDPVMGYVMIPCIERNSMGILRSLDAALLAKCMSKIKEHVVSFDVVVKTMNETGKQIPISLKETSIGGLAKEFSDE